MALAKLSKAHVAELLKDDGVVGYGTIRRLRGLVSLNMEVKETTELFHADNVVDDKYTKFEECTVTLVIKEMPLEDYRYLYNKTVDTDGLTVDKTDDEQSWKAFGFEGGIGKNDKRMVWLTKGYFEPISEEFKTEAGGVEVITQELQGTFIARATDNVWRKRADSTDTNMTPEKVETFFDTVAGIAPTPVTP
ncbi:major tail protein [Priestia megaterium]|uniref:major tail protein n=1 Tax=Priestia megaterium TaxID=1404 RepID=UPI003CC6175B